MKYSTKASKESINKTIENLKGNGISAELVENAEQALKRFKDLVPEGSEVMQMTSVTLDNLGISKEINESGKYNAVKAKIYSEGISQNEKNKLGAAPEIAVGSVHAVTENGKVLIASNTGSQLPAYVYGAQKVIWIVGTQKITSDLDEAMDRVYTHVLPLESERAKKAYGVEGSYVSKLLIINKEVNPNRIHLIFVDENVGF
jgi:ribosomal protein S21